MFSLYDAIREAESKKIAVGHFNISDLTAFKGIFEAAVKLNTPVIIGVSEGEREFLGVKNAASLVKNLRGEGFPIFLNADHTHSLDKAKEAVDAGFDAVLFDGGKLPIEENIKITKEVVDYAKNKNESILVEGELGYIGSGSVILKEMPEGAAVSENDFTQPEIAREFVEKTGIDLLAPAVGNIHGMFANMPNPRLDIKRIMDIRSASNAPLVLHGGSGTSDEDFSQAIEAGISVIHINTEIRIAWRQGMEKALRDNPENIVPYKVLPVAIEEIQGVVSKRLKLFNKML